LLPLDLVGLAGRDWVGGRSRGIGVRESHLIIGVIREEGKNREVDLPDNHRDE
jgi:hypothetical protein